MLSSIPQDPSSLVFEIGRGMLVGNKIFRVSKLRCAARHWVMVLSLCSALTQAHTSMSAV